jgi:hypothetical protein
MVFANADSSEKVPVLIASAKKSDYNQTLQLLPFTMTNVNLKSFFERYPNYNAEVVATGRLPKRNVYITGGFMVNASFRIR